MKASECAICGCDIGRHNSTGHGCECGYCTTFAPVSQSDIALQAIADRLGRIAVAHERANELALLALALECARLNGGPSIESKTAVPRIRALLAKTGGAW